MLLIQTPLDRPSLITAVTSVNQKLDFSQQWQNLHQKVTEIQTQLTALNKELELKLFRHQQIQKQIDSYPQGDFYNLFYRDHHQLQLELFQRAWAFLLQEVLRRKESVMRALSTYGSVLTGDGEALLKLSTDGDAIYRDLSLIFPVISSSLQSVRNMLPILQPNSVKLALVDEAGTSKTIRIRHTGGNANLCCVEFRHMSALDTLPDPQSPKVGKTEKSEPPLSGRKSPNQRRHEDVRSREYLFPCLVKTEK
ncbi:hypothetical protein LC612_39255 [Nostoc sp. CHAB 5834]|nr:hypothetical protein [Nostoc sp. CHAB 5834]